MNSGHEYSAVSWSALGRIVAVLQVMSLSGLRVVALCRARTLPCRMPPGHDTNFVSQHRPLPRAVSLALPRVSQRSCAVSQGAAAPYRSLYRFPYCDTKAAPSHDTNDCIATHPMAKPCARAPLAPTRRQAVSWPCWPCYGVVSQGFLAVSWPPCCTPQRPVSRYNPLYRDSNWKTGSCPFQLLPLLQFFFSLIFFFIFVPPIGKPQKNILFFFSFSSRTK